MQNPQDKLQVLKVLDVLAIIDPLEAGTRASNDEETAAFRAALGSILSASESDLLDLVEDVSALGSVRKVLMDSPRCRTKCAERQIR